MNDIIRYQQEDGREPYTEWFRSLRDRLAMARIAARLRQVESENFGDCKPVGEGVTELRIDVGADIGCTAEGMKEAGSFSFAEEIKTVKRKTSQEPRRFGLTGNGGNHEEACWRSFASPERD